MKPPTNPRDELILKARKIFVDYNNEYIHENHEDEAGLLMDHRDTNYFRDPQVIADVDGPGMMDRTLIVYQPLNDELGSIGFIIVCHDDYSAIRHIVLEVDTSYDQLEVPNGTA
jgi:hypothetical protein